MGVCAAHAGGLHPTAVGLLAELPDRIDREGKPGASHQCEEAREKPERHLKVSGVCLKFDTPPPTATPPPELRK